MKWRVDGPPGESADAWKGFVDDLRARGLRPAAGGDREDVHRIVYAASGDASRTAYSAFERKWTKRCPGVVRSLQEGGAELLYPKWVGGLAIGGGVPTMVAGVVIAYTGFLGLRTDLR